MAKLMIMSRVDTDWDFWEYFTAYIQVIYTPDDMDVQSSNFCIIHGQDRTGMITHLYLSIT